MQLKEVFCSPQCGKTTYVCIYSVNSHRFSGRGNSRRRTGTRLSPTKTTLHLHEHVPRLHDHVFFPGLTTHPIHPAKICPIFAPWNAMMFRICHAGNTQTFWKIAFPSIPKNDIQNTDHASAFGLFGKGQACKGLFCAVEALIFLNDLRYKEAW